MHIFYKCLIKIDSLNDYDLHRLNNTCESLSKKETRKTNVKLEKESNICWFILHSLRFIKRYQRDEKYSTPAILVYKYLFHGNLTFICNGAALTYAGIKEGLERRMRENKKYEEKEIEEILVLADELYRKSIDPES